jgi:hypothetical protein
MAEDLTPRPSEPPPAAAEREAPGAAERETPPYQARFQLLFGVLLGVGLAALAATVLFVAVGKKGASDNAVNWSPWRPNATDGLAAVQQIADHVGQRYTLPSGNQLVAVRGGALELAGLPVTIALRSPAPNQGKIAIEDKKGVLYTLCGLGKLCSIKEGKPSVPRHLVLRRESLELALYTFRYIRNIDEVIVMLPPPPGKKPSEVMYFRRGDVGASLDRPLAVTLPGAPPAINRLGNVQADFINRMTGPNLFSFEAVQGQDAKVYLVLDPIPATP